MILPADVARCEGITNERGFVALRCVTCARRQAWRDDLANEPERVVLMEPMVTKSSECTSHIPMRKVPK